MIVANKKCTLCACLYIILACPALLRFAVLRMYTPVSSHPLDSESFFPMYPTHSSPPVVCPLGLLLYSYVQLHAYLPVCIYCTRAQLPPSAHFPIELEICMSLPTVMHHLHTVPPTDLSPIIGIQAGIAAAGCALIVIIIVAITIVLVCIFCPGQL